MLKHRTHRPDGTVEERAYSPAEEAARQAEEATAAADAVERELQPQFHDLLDFLVDKGLVDRNELRGFIQAKRGPR